MAWKNKYIRCVFTVRSHITNYYYKIAIIKNKSILKLKIIIRVQNIIQKQLYKHY
jgi:hypothetical protein